MVKRLTRTAAEPQKRFKPPGRGHVPILPAPTAVQDQRISRMMSLSTLVSEPVCHPPSPKKVACQACRKAKVKCVFGENHQPCKRCLNLDISCFHEVKVAVRRELNARLSADPISELMTFFQRHMARQLFGEELSIPATETDPFLSTSICLVASIIHETHHAMHSEILRSFEEQLGKIISGSIDANKRETVLALCVAAFWLGRPAGMLVALAARIAKTLRLHLIPQDRWLWELVFAVDGIYSLGRSEAPLLSGSPSEMQHFEGIVSRLTNSRGNINLEISSGPVAPYSSTLQLNMAFQLSQSLRFYLDSWLSLENLMPPEILGVPFKTNIELDRWMVSWACKLSSYLQVTAYPAKLMLFHYYYAKMIINKRFDQHNTNNDGVLIREGREGGPGFDGAQTSALRYEAAEYIARSACDPEIKEWMRYGPAYCHAIFLTAAEVLAQQMPYHSGDKHILLLLALRDEVRQALQFHASESLGHVFASKLFDLVESTRSHTGSPRIVHISETKTIAAWPGSIAVLER